LIEIGAQVVALGGPHPVEIRERRVGRFAGARRDVGHCGSVGLGRLLANRQGLRQPQQISRRQHAGHQATRARLAERRLERRAELLVELHLDAGRLSQLYRQAQFDASTCHMPTDQRAHVGFDGGEALRDAQLQIEVAVVQRANRDGDRRAFVLAGHRGEPGHRLDHEGTMRRSALRPSSSCIW